MTLGTQVRMGMIFDEWARRYAENPNEFDGILGKDGQPVEGYGEACAIYFEKLAKEMDFYGMLPKEQNEIIEMDSENLTRCKHIDLLSLPVGTCLVPYNEKGYVLLPSENFSVAEYNKWKHEILDLEIDGAENLKFNMKKIKMKTQIIKYSSSGGIYDSIEFNLQTESEAREAFKNLVGATECTILSVISIEDNPDNISGKELAVIFRNLSEAAHLEGSEIGEFWLSVACLFEDYEYCMVPQFRAAVLSEIVRINNEIEKDYHIIEEEEPPRPPIKVKRLEYIK